jgi:hypothetical protein
MGRDRDDKRNLPGKNRPANGGKAENQDGKSTRRVNRNGAGEAADWESCDPATLAKAVANVGARGGALRLGYTTDGGAYAIGIYGDGEPYTEYVRPSENITDFLEQLIEQWA